jgi:histidinol-phosphate aminotransferase
MTFRDHLRPVLSELRAYRTFEYRSGLTRLDANESPFPLDPDEQHAYARVFAETAFHRYPEVSGRPVREALAVRWGVSPDEILVGSGSDEIISILVTAFGASRSGPAAVLYPVPTFGEYRSLALVHGATPIEVPLDAQWQLDQDRLTNAIAQHKPSLAFFASPNNPTGNRFSAPVLEALCGCLDGCFVVDEAYADFGGVSLVPKLASHPNLCVMKSLSKIGLAGLRLGALIGSRELIAELDKVRLPYNVNVLSQALACAALSDPARMDGRIGRIAELRRGLEAALRTVPGLTVYPSDSNFVLVRTPTDAGRVFDSLLERDVLVRNLSQPGALDNCLRITAGTESENEQCIEALRAAMGVHA